MAQTEGIVVNLTVRDEITPVLDPLRIELVEMQLPARLWDEYYAARHSKDTERLAKARIEIVAAVWSAVWAIADRSHKAPVE